MNFGQMSKELFEGERMERESWEKGTFIYLTNESSVPTDYLRGNAFHHLGPTIKGQGRTVTIEQHIDMYTPQETIIVGWRPTIEDLVATDWRRSE